MILSKNDRIKGEESAPFAQQTIEIHQRLLTLYKNSPDDICKKALEIIPISIATARACPQSTYGLLQEGSKTWHEIKKIFYGQFWGEIKDQHKRLNDLYLLASNNAYKKIGESYSSEVKKLYGQLWSTSLSTFQNDLFFSKEIAAAQLFLIASFRACLKTQDLK